MLLDLMINLLFSGVWGISFNMGGFIGPSAFGAIVESIGYRYSTLIFVVVFALMAIMNFIDAMSQRSVKKMEYKPLK